MLSGLAEGTYLYSGRTTDLAGNTSGSLTNSLAIDKTAPIIVYTGATPASGASLSGALLTGQVDITEANIRQFIWWQNGSGYSLFDSGLVLAYNFNKLAALNETDGNIDDISMYSANASGY